MIISARDKDLGGFFVHRILPYATHRMVGPFIFLDHIGPAKFGPDQGMEVRPHPHINLATVTYLYEGKIRHQDSLGSDQLIEPGAINWMTAGRGIVHSERTPADVKKAGGSMHGIQCWVALPTEAEEIEPSFKHHPATSLPEFSIGEVKAKLLLGKAFGHQSPVELHSELFYLDLRMPAGSSVTLPHEDQEAAVYVVEGELSGNEKTVEALNMMVRDDGESLTVTAKKDSKVLLVGGKPVGKRHIYWNFVSSTEERINEAKAHWVKGPGAEGSRFEKIPNDHHEFIPLPPEPGGHHNPPGTVMK